MSTKSPLNRPGIYRITCQANGRVYVGSAANIRKRWKLHRGHLRMGIHHNRPLQNAWRKYGEAEFDFDLLEFCEESDLAKREQAWMDSLRAYDRRHGFNVLMVAYASVGLKHSKETRERLKTIAKARGYQPHLAAANEARKGKPSPLRGRPGRVWTESEREAASAARKGRQPWNVGVPMPEEVKARVAATCRIKCRTYTDEQRDRVIELRNAGMAYIKIAEATGISLAQCHKIFNGKTGKRYVKN